MRRLCSVLLMFLLPLAGSADTGAPGSAASGFDFLLGQWAVEVHVKVSSLAALIHGTPKLVGRFEARRTDDGIEDELAIVDASGNPRSTNRALRRFDAARAVWAITNTDVERARTTTAQAQRDGDEMHVEGSYVRDGDTVLTRSRYHAIGANTFRYSQDRSSDGGKSWDVDVFGYTATRVGPPTP